MTVPSFRSDSGQLAAVTGIAAMQNCAAALQIQIGWPTNGGGGRSHTSLSPQALPVVLVVLLPLAGGVLGAYIADKGSVLAVVVAVVGAGTTWGKQWAAK